jgi:hypothetical protein
MMAFDQRDPLLALLDQAVQFALFHLKDQFSLGKEKPGDIEAHGIENIMPAGSRRRGEKY